MTEVKLSARAAKVLARIKQGDFYPAWGDRARKSLNELEAAGLIRKGGRAVTIGAFYVPTTGYIFMQLESFAGDGLPDERYSAALVREAAPELLDALKISLTCDVPLWFKEIANSAIAKAEARSESLPLSKGQEEGNG